MNKTTRRGVQVIEATIRRSKRPFLDRPKSERGRHRVAPGRTRVTAMAGYLAHSFDRRMRKLDLRPSLAWPYNLMEINGG